MDRTLDDIFNDDEFGLLNSEQSLPKVKTEENRMIDSFEEINSFFEKQGREPSNESMSEYNLSARLKAFREDERKKGILYPFDRYKLLGQVAIERKHIEDVLKEDDFGLLNQDGDHSIYDLKNLPKKVKKNRSQTDLIANREPIPEEEFKRYERIFQLVHKDLKEGKRRFVKFTNPEKNLQAGNFYLLDGQILFLEAAELKYVEHKLKTGNRKRLDGRTVTIFENATKSDLLFRSLAKVLLKEGKIITQFGAYVRPDLDVSSNVVAEDDVQSGWIYVLKSKSNSPQISGIKNLYKIGFSTTSVETRIKNAKKEATYLFDDVEVVAKYSCYNMNTQKFEGLLHRFFGKCCLDIDIYNKDGRRANPREWFVVPIEIVNRVIDLVLCGDINKYVYDTYLEKIFLKDI